MECYHPVLDLTNWDEVHKASDWPANENIGY